MSSPRRVTSVIRSNRLPRDLHPVAWWLWAIGMAAAVGQTTDPILLVLALAVLAFVVSSRRTDAPWARGYKYYLYLALSVVAIRVIFRSVFGGDVGGPGSHVIFQLPHLHLPAWAAGVQVGGPVTVEGTLSALYGGLRLATLLCCLGAANVLANPKRALRSLPGALYELGVAAVVAFNVGPQLIESAQRVRRAGRLRGSAHRWRHAVKAMIVPVLEEAFERSLRLASSMDTRGFGRTRSVPRRVRRQTALLLFAGLFLLCVGMFGLLDASAPSIAALPAVALGAVMCVAGLIVGSRGVGHTNYRPDPWNLPEWVVVASGLAPAVVLIAGLWTRPGALNPAFSPITWPALPVVPACVLLVAASAGVVAPPPRGQRMATGVAPAPTSPPPPSPARRGPEPGADTITVPVAASPDIAVGGRLDGRSPRTADRAQRHDRGVRT